MSKHYADMITFSQAGKEYDFSNLMNATTKFYRKIALAKGQNLTLKRYKKFTSKLSLKGSDLQYIIAALLDNALRFTPKDGIIDIHISHTKDAVDIVVVDSGAGMKPQEIEAMLEPGVSGKKVMNQGKQKDGLGLHIIRELLKSKQGSLFIGNNEPQGLIVTVRIPFLRK
jgi:signal transduction histidine kinase